MLVKEYEPLYTLIEPILCKNPVQLTTYTLVRIMKWDEFRRKYQDCHIYSIRDFENTCTTSIIFGTDPFDEPVYVSVHHKDGRIEYRESIPNGKKD